MNRTLAAQLSIALMLASEAAAAHAMPAPGVRSAVRTRTLSRSGHPMEQPIPLHRSQDWRLVVERDGRPVEGAVADVGGGMPLHFHGFPTKPVAGPAPEGGYMIRGIKFSMRGWWRLKLDIKSRDGSDRIAFDVRLSGASLLHRKCDVEDAPQTDIGLLPGSRRSLCPAWRHTAL